MRKIISWFYKKFVNDIYIPKGTVACISKSSLNGTDISIVHDTSTRNDLYIFSKQLGNLKGE